MNLFSGSGGFFDNFHSSYTGGTQGKEEKARLRESSCMLHHAPTSRVCSSSPWECPGVHCCRWHPRGQAGHKGECRKPCLADAARAFPGRNGADKQTTLLPLQNKLRKRGIESSHTCVSAQRQGPGTPDSTPADPHRREKSACPEPLGGAWGCPAKPPQPHHMYRSRPAGKLGCLM